METKSVRTRQLDTVVLEVLEPRLLMDAVYPTAYEQYMLELINRGRADPQAEVDRYPAVYWTGTPDLNEGIDPPEITTEPKQPLAFNPYLVDSAGGHSQWMLDADTFSHAGAGGSSPKDRMVAAGYVFTPPWGLGENIALQYSTAPLDVTTAVEAMARGLFTDKNYPGRGHRVNLMHPDYREIGVGVRDGMFKIGQTDYHAVDVTEDFAYVGSGVFLTGVVYDDADTDAFYTPGEGHAAVTIKATRTSDGSTFTTTTWDAGGYTLSVPAGTYDVTAYGGPLGEVYRETGIVVTDENEKVDFVAPAGLFGDFTDDGVVDDADVNALLAAIRSGSPAASFDLTGDSPAVVDRADVDVLVQDFVFVNGSAADRGTAYGDANLDGAVDDDDLSLLLANWGTDATWATGNFIDTVGGAATVNDDDLSLLLSNWTGPQDIRSAAEAPAAALSPSELAGPVTVDGLAAAPEQRILLATHSAPATASAPDATVDHLLSARTSVAPRWAQGTVGARHGKSVGGERPRWRNVDALALVSADRLGLDI